MNWDRDASAAAAAAAAAGGRRQASVGTEGAAARRRVDELGAAVGHDTGLAQDSTEVAGMTKVSTFWRRGMARTSGVSSTPKRWFESLEDLLTSERGRGVVAWPRPPWYLRHERLRRLSEASAGKPAARIPRRPSPFLAAETYRPYSTLQPFNTFDVPHATDSIPFERALQPQRASMTSSKSSTASRRLRKGAPGVKGHITAHRARRARSVEEQDEQGTQELARPQRLVRGVNVAEGVLCSKGGVAGNANEAATRIQAEWTESRLVGTCTDGTRTGIVD